jgi:hypothetical protein
MNKLIDKVQTTNPNESVVNGEVVSLALRQRAITNAPDVTGPNQDAAARDKINEILEALRNVGIISRF